MKTAQIIVEKHTDGYAAYAVGVEGIVAGQGDTSEAAEANARSALKFHVETFGLKVPEPGTAIEHTRHTPSPQL